MPKLSEARLQARRNRILAAAYRCFARSGFNRSTMRDICREAGLSLGGVYVHFESKEALMAALAALGRESTKKLLGGGRPEESRSVAALLEVLLHQLTIKDCVESIRLDVRLWGEALHTPALRREVVQAFANVRQPFEDAAERAQKKGELPREASAENAARVVMGIFLGLAVQKAIDPTIDIESCARFVRSVLAGPPGKGRRHK